MMRKKKGILATIAVPAVLLAAGAGVGLVVAKEPAPREAREARSSIPVELAEQLRQAARAEAGRAQAVARKKKKPRRPGRRMTVARAEKSAEASARRTAENQWDDIAWDEYGTSGCKRLSRPAMTCLSWVQWTEPSYNDSEYGSLYTCEWWVTSRWDKKKAKRGKKTSYRLKVIDGRGKAACDYE